MKNAQNYTYSTASEMFRSVLGKSAVKPVDVRLEEKTDKAISEYIRKFSAACSASAGGLMMFKCNNPLPIAVNGGLNAIGRGLKEIASAIERASRR